MPPVLAIKSILDILFVIFSIVISTTAQKRTAWFYFKLFFFNYSSKHTIHSNAHRYSIHPPDIIDLEIEKMASRTGRTPKSAMAILGTLASHGPMCPLEICEKLDMAPRTVSFALRQLLGKKLLRKIPNLNDMRRPMYHVNLDAAKELLQKYNDTALNVQPSPLAWRQKA